MATQGNYFEGLKYNNLVLKTSNYRNSFIILLEDASMFMLKEHLEKFKVSESQNIYSISVMLKGFYQICPPTLLERISVLRNFLVNSPTIYFFCFNSLTTFLPKTSIISICNNSQELINIEEFLCFYVPRLFFKCHSNTIYYFLPSV